MSISALRQFFRPLWVRLLVVLIIVVGGIGLVLLLQAKKNPQQANCTGSSCQAPKTNNPQSTQPQTPSDESKTPEEQKKAEEQKKVEEQKTQQNTPKPTGTTGETNNPPTGGGGTTTPPPSSGTQSCPAYPAFPDESCTGVPAGVSLASAGGSFSTTSVGQTINGMLIDGDLVLNHDNVTVTNSRIKGRVIANGHRGFTLKDADIGGDACPASSNGGDRLINADDYTLIRVHAHHNGADLIAINGGGTITIQDSLINKTCYYDGDHLDAIQFYDPGSVANVTLSHNTIDARPVSGGFGNAAIFIADSPGAGSRFNIYNNYMAGGNYTLYALDALNGSGVIIDVAGNRFLQGQYNYGPCALSNSDPYNGNSGIIWNNNAFTTGAAITYNDC